MVPLLSAKFFSPCIKAISSILMPWLELIWLHRRQSRVSPKVTVYTLKGTPSILFSFIEFKQTVQHWERKNWRGMDTAIKSKNYYHMFRPELFNTIFKITWLYLLIINIHVNFFHIFKYNGDIQSYQAILYTREKYVPISVRERRFLFHE